MQVERKSITTAKSAKDYLSKNEVPQLFECLMTGLMYHRPSDHITYLQDCLERIKKQGINGVRWDMFLDSKKTPLPPIDSVPRENYRPQPLPEIGSLQLRIPIDSSIVLIQTGPGLDKKSICRYLVANFPGFVHIETGTIVRERALIESQDNDSLWKSTKKTINDGDLAPEDFVIECLVREINKHDDKSKFVIEGFPRTDRERQDFERFIGFNRLRFMLLIDCEEDTCQKALQKRTPQQGWSDHAQTSINRRIFNYKSNTLAVCKYFDDHGKLLVLDGDKDRNLVMKDVQRVFNDELEGPPCLNPPISPQKPEPTTVDEELLVAVSPGREPVTDIEQLVDVISEQERNPELPQCRLILLLGGPGAGKSTVAQMVCKKHPTWVHIDVNNIIRTQAMTAKDPDNGSAASANSQPFVEDWDISVDTLKDIIKEIPEETEVIILEGFPKNSVQLNEFNTEIGRADFVILLDSEEEAMRARLSERYCREHKVEDEETNSDLRILHFKNNGLPLCRHFDELSKMCIVPGDRDILYVTSDFEKVAVKKLEIISDADALKKAEAEAAAKNMPVSPNNNIFVDGQDNDAQSLYEEKEAENEEDISALFGVEDGGKEHVGDKADEDEENNNGYEEGLAALFGGEDSNKEDDEDKVDDEEDNNDGNKESLMESMRENNEDKIEDVNENEEDVSALHVGEENTIENDGNKVDNEDENENGVAVVLGGEDSTREYDGDKMNDVDENEKDVIGFLEGEEIAREDEEKVDGEKDNDNENEEDVTALFGGEDSTRENDEGDNEKVEAVEPLGDENAGLNDGDETNEETNKGNETKIDATEEEENSKMMINEEVKDGVSEDVSGQNVERTPSQMQLDEGHVVLLLGGPGSGIKTLGSHLVTKYLVAFIQVDQLVADAIDLESVGTEEFKKYLANQEFDETPVYALIRRSLLSSMSMSKVLFVAGFPRTGEQFQLFNSEVCSVSATIFLDVDEDTLKNRLAARADPELPLGYMDQLELFKNNRLPLLEQLNDSKLFSKIDGTLSEVEVLEQVSAVVENFPFMKHAE